MSAATEALGTCVHGFTLAPYDLPGHAPYPRRPDDPITSHRCQICRLAWTLSRGHRSWPTWDDIEDARLMVVAQYTVEEDRKRKARLAQEEREAWVAEQRKTVPERDTCPACLREITVKLSVFDKPFGHDFTPHGPLDPSRWGGRQGKRRCPGKDVWRWTAEEPYYNSGHRQQLMLSARGLLRSLRHDKPNPRLDHLSKRSTTHYGELEYYTGPPPEPGDLYAWLLGDDEPTHESVMRQVDIAWRNHVKRGRPLPVLGE